MKVLRNGAIVAILLGIVALLGSVVVENSFSGRAKLVQRVQKSEGAELFGESGTPIGSPQKLIVDDPKAFIGEKTPDGAEIVDDGYLKANRIYPLQMQTVSYVAGLVRIASVAAVAFGMVAWVVLRRKSVGALSPQPLSP